MSHPDAKQLQLFVAGRLNDAESEQIEAHLENCPDCLQRVTELERSPIDPLFEGLQAVGRGDISTESSSSGSLDGHVDELSVAMPELIGNYTILGILGSGGMGTVYRGENPHLRRHAAIKVIKPSRSLRKSSVERFQRELIASGKLQHRHIVATFDGGLFENRPYLVMELLDGTNLARYVKDIGPLPIKEACEIIRQVALGLQYIHEAGLIHRDIKPSNLFRTNEETIKILDLGLARLLETETSETAFSAIASPGETLEGDRLGTPDYMSPEQAVDPKNVGFHSDIYSLGCTFFYLLTGTAPFAEKPEISEKIDAHIKLDLPPLKDFRGGVPPIIETLLQRMASKKIAERPRAVEIAAVLERYLLPSKRKYLIAAALASMFLLCVLGWVILKPTPPETLVTMDDVESKITELLQSTDSLKDIFEAAEKGTAQDVQHFIDKGEDVNLKNADGLTPLHFAAASNPDVNVLETLIVMGAEVHAKNIKGSTPLHAAASTNHNVDVLKFLIENKADVNMKRDSDRISPLHLAVANNPKVDVLKTLIAKGADVNAKDNTDTTPLHFAVNDNSGIDAPKLLLENGADANAKNKSGYMPLHNAVYNPNVGVWETLIQGGADVNAKSGSGRTPLHYAVGRHYIPTGTISYNSNVEVIKYLIEQGADVNVRIGTENSETPLFLAAQYNPNVDVMKTLIENGAEVNAKNYKGETPLDHADSEEKKNILRAAGGKTGEESFESKWSNIFGAAEAGTVQDVKYFVENGVDVNVKKSDGWAPLHSASGFNSKKEVLIALIESGAQVNTKNNRNETPLHLAARNNSNVDVLKTLLENGAEVNATNDRNQTPLFYAADSNPNVDILKLLIESGADVNIKDTVPQRSSGSDNNIRRVFIENGVSVNAEDYKGKTPFDRANSEAKKNILREAGGMSGETMETTEGTSAIPLKPVEAEEANMPGENSDGSLMTFTVPRGAVENVIFSPDDRFVLASGSSGDVFLWNTDDREKSPKNLFDKLSLPSNIWFSKSVNGLCFSKDGKSFFTGVENGIIYQWNTASSKLLGRYVYAELPGNANPALGVHTIALSPNEEWLAAAGGASGIVIWNLKTRDVSAKKEFFVEGNQYIATSVAFSPNNKSIIATGGNEVRLYELGANSEIADYTVIDVGFEGLTYCGTFSPSGHWIMATSDDNTVRVWDVANKKVYRKFNHPDKVHQAIFSPDERLVLSGCYDGTARLWNLETGEEVGRLEGHTDRIEYGIAFSTKGDLIATGSYDKTVKIWKVPPNVDIIDKTE